MSFASPIIGAVQHECRCGSGLEDGERLMQPSPSSRGGTARLAAGTLRGSGAGQHRGSGLESQRRVKTGQSRCLCARVKASEAFFREEGSALPFQLSFGTKDPEQSLGASRFRVPSQGTSCKGWKVWWFQLKWHFLGNF